MDAEITQSAVRMAKCEVLRWFCDRRIELRKIHKTVVTPATVWMYWTETSVSEENAREEVGCDGNEDVEMDDWSHKAKRNTERKNSRGRISIKLYMAMDIYKVLSKIHI